MENMMRSRSLLLLTAIGFLLGGATAGAGTYVQLSSSPQTDGEIVDVQVVEQNAETTTIAYALEGFELSSQTVGGQTFYEVTLGDESRALESAIEKFIHHETKRLPSSQKFDHLLGKRLEVESDLAGYSDKELSSAFDKIKERKKRLQSFDLGKAQKEKKDEAE